MEKSDSIKSLGKALSLFQTKMDKIKKDATNPFFKSKYASLSTILENVQLPLAECGLTFSQLPDGDCLTTLLIHIESGEYLQSCYNIHPAKNDPQGIGSAISYARRYALTSILAINVEEDDDGNGATHKPAASTNGQSANGKITPNAAISDDDKEWLNENTEQFEKACEFIQNGGTIFDIRKKYKVSKKIETLLNEKRDPAPAAVVANGSTGNDDLPF